MCDINYKTFIMKDIFNLQTGALMENKYLEKGSLPRITATDLNNGIAMFTNHSNHKNFRVFENFISISFLGSVFYQKGKASLDMKIHGIKPKNYELNSNLALYLIPLIKNFSCKYEYGYQLSMRLLTEQRIILPVDKNNSPDWEYMESYISNKKLKKCNTLKEFLRYQLNQIGKFESVSISGAEWKTFTLGEIVSIKNGIRLTKNNMIIGTRPFIGASDSNNGITNFVSNTNSSLGFNTLGVNYNGSVGEGFFHPYEAIFSDDVKQLNFKNGVNNEFTLHFLQVSIRKQKDKFGYAYKFNSERMKNLRILLPVDRENNINFNFMENYIKGIKAKKIKKALEFLE